MNIKLLTSHLDSIGALAESRWDLPSVYPSAHWWEAIEAGLKYRFYMLAAYGKEDGIEACLPLMLVQSALFGKFLVSLPYLNSGGLLFRCVHKESDRRDLTEALISGAVKLADKLDVKHLELRHEVRYEHPSLNYERTDKVHMRMRLPATGELLMTSFKSKLRSQIKKAGENPFEIRIGGEELLKDFYSVFAHNMRDLGTPVYSSNLFKQILRSFAKSNGAACAELCVVHLDHQPISGALLVHYGRRTEVPSASALRKYNPTNVNMWMYRQLLERAIEKGATEFDFGRSTIGSSTYKFKEQWGAKPSPAIWQYYVRKGDPGDMRPDSQGKQSLIRIWQKLPISLTKLVGPSIVRGIP